MVEQAYAPLISRTVFTGRKGSLNPVAAKIAIKRKLYEKFHFFYFQKRIVSAETIRGNTVN